MKIHDYEPQNGGASRSCCQLKNTTKIVVLVASILLLSTILTQYFSLGPTFQWSSIASSSTSTLPRGSRTPKKCDIFRGEWIPNPNAPYYTNQTCWAIHNHQNCMKHGRPDDGFMKWRWKPNGCDLPIFDPAQFLEIVRGKSLAFLGDSVSRNHMQSLICLLLKETYAVNSTQDPFAEISQYLFPTYNFRVASLWSQYLVKTDKVRANGTTKIEYRIHLDEPDSKWTTRIEEFDYVIVSAGHWFYASDMHDSYRKALRTTFQFFSSSNNFKGTLALLTFSPKHFENGEWNTGGTCVRTKPFASSETKLEGIGLELYKIQLEEYKAAESEGSKKGIKYMLLDTTYAMLLRPDGHPSIYGHGADEEVNDCLHWCLPGPVDTWNDFLLEMLKMEGKRSSES